MARSFLARSLSCKSNSFPYDRLFTRTPILKRRISNMAYFINCIFSGFWPWLVATCVWYLFPVLGQKLNFTKMFNLLRQFSWPSCASFLTSNPDFIDDCFHFWVWLICLKPVLKQKPQEINFKLQSLKLSGRMYGALCCNFYKNVLVIIASPRGGDTSRMCGPLPKTHTLFMTKICDFPYPIYDLPKYSKPYLWHDPYIKTLLQTCLIISSLVQTNVKIAVNRTDHAKPHLIC